MPQEAMESAVEWRRMEQIEVLYGWLALEYWKSGMPVEQVAWLVEAQKQGAAARRQKLQPLVEAAARACAATDAARGHGDPMGAAEAAVLVAAEATALETARETAAMVREAGAHAKVMGPPLAERVHTGCSLGAAAVPRRCTSGAA